MARPGIMLYFDMLEPIRVLPDADKGRLLVAMLEYGKDGIAPQFDGMLALAWGFVKPKLDRDEESYDNAKLQRQYAAFCKQRKNMNLPKIPLEEWMQMDPDERKRMATADNGPLRPVDSVAPRYPSTSTTAAVSTSTSSSVSTTAAVSANRLIDTAAAADREIKALQGELGKGVVFMSTEQMEDLLERLGLEAYDYYVKKLANFIIKNNADVRNHYETILKWWNEDGHVREGRPTA